MNFGRCWLVLLFCLMGFSSDGAERVHGLWVWKTDAVLAKAGSGEALRDFCRSNRINEVYLSMTSKAGLVEDPKVRELLAVLHGAKIRVEALYGSADGDLPAPREKLLEQVRGIVKYNAAHPTNRFDGIHLDIEPHQRPENKGEGNLKFLPGLTATFRAVREIAGPAGMTVNADIANKVLKGSVEERRELLLSVDRVTLMLYELSSPTDGKTIAQQLTKLRGASERYLGLAYAGITEAKAAGMVIALRTADYTVHLPAMLQAMDDSYGANPRYLGWARHSYNDVLAGK
jgi:hypothetical protein